MSEDSVNTGRQSRLPWQNQLRTIATPMIAGAALYAFVSQPILRFSSPKYLLFFAYCMTLCFMILWQTNDQPSTRRAKVTEWTKFGIAAVFFAVGSALAALATTEAIRDFDANDRRCLALQADMLSAKPALAHGPDLFQALGCRPQGSELVHFPTKLSSGTGQRTSEPTSTSAN